MRRERNPGTILVPDNERLDDMSSGDWVYTIERVCGINEHRLQYS